MSMNFHNMEYLSNINNIYKYIHNPYECLRGQRWPYSDSDNFGAYVCMYTYSRIWSKSKRVTGEGSNTRVGSKVKLTMRLRLCHLIESRVKQMSEFWADEDELDDNHTSGQRFCVVSALLAWLSTL
jgi:hypothetical protein